MQRGLLEGDDVCDTLVGSHAFDDIDDGLADWEPVPESILEGPWRLVGSYKWKRSEDISTLEARGLLYGITRLVRSASNIGSRLLVLSDSMVVTLAGSKGRSSAANLVQVMRSIAALLLATNCLLCLRWIPSEKNIADAPSMGVSATWLRQGRSGHPCFGQAARRAR